MATVAFIYKVLGLKKIGSSIFTTDTTLFFFEI